MNLMSRLRIRRQRADGEKRAAVVDRSRLARMGKLRGRQKINDDPDYLFIFDFTCILHFGKKGLFDRHLQINIYSL